MVDDVDFRLEHFRRFLKKWESVPCEIDVPAVDFQGAWAIFHASRDMPEMEDVHAGVNDDRPYRSGVADIDDWLRAYRAGQYEELPASLAPSRLGPGYSDAAALTLAALQIIRKGYASHEELMAEHRARGFAMDRADGLSIRTIAQNETDFWLGTAVARLARSLTLPSKAKQEMGTRLQEEFARYPRKKFGARLRMADLQSYLSLPIWKKRHELYAVWIATEIVNALPDHRCEVHHEDGRIAFAFRETLVATVKASWPPVRLISERRVPLAAPIGEGRSGNVQPDYGLWRRESGMETCGLVVEVKHYKRSAPASFSDVLIDYARALPNAQVYLVNHGPVGSATKNVPDELLSRCNTISNLTATHLPAREELRDAVRKYVGPPVTRPAGAGAARQADTVLAIDISPSMSSYLRGPDFLGIISNIIDDRCEKAALVDEDIRDLVPLDELADALAAADGESTDLDEPVRALLGTFKRVLLLTDTDGANTLRHVPNQTVISRPSGLVAIEVLSE